MSIATYIVMGVILAIIAIATIKIIRDKKNGVKCIGCPCANGCKAQDHAPCGNCTYHTHEKTH